MEIAEKISRTVLTLREHPSRVYLYFKYDAHLQTSLVKIVGKHVIKMFTDVNEQFVDYFQAVFQQSASRRPIIDK